MDNSFAIHLGGGAYLDASGKIVFGPPSGAQIYQPPIGFHIAPDPKKVQEIFKDLSDILPRNEDGRKKWKEWGVPNDLVNFLSTIAGVVGITVSGIAIYAWAIGTLIKVMNLIADDQGMSPELAKTLYSIKNQLQAKEEIDRANHMIEMHAEFDGRIRQIRGLLTRLAVEQPVGGARAQIFADMQAKVWDLGGKPLSELFNQVWTTSYHAEAYDDRVSASGYLVFERPDGTLAPVPTHPPGLTVFDYRLGVPMLIYGATTFVALAQIAMPWFRSAGVYAGHLRYMADAIDRFVLRMQDECLARTEYTGQSAFEADIWRSFRDLPGHGRPPFDGYPTLPVGAFDLVQYSDSFLMFATNPEIPSQRGLFNFHWLPPGYDPLQRPNWDAIAAAANEQARLDYANLQVATGMFRLVSTAAWLRYLSTPPIRSQTMSGFVVDSRYFQNEAPTTAKSPPIRPVGVIEHAATLKRYEAHSRVRITTESLAAFRYKVVLRTIDSDFGGGSWRSQEYVGDIWRPDYEPTQIDPRCKRLTTEIRRNSILSEVVLYEGPTPSHALARGGHANLRATTFDWYVPVVAPLWSLEFRNIPITKAASEGGKITTLGTGGVSIHFRGNESEALGPIHFLNDPAPLRAPVVDDLRDDVAGFADLSLDKAERRHVDIEDVRVEWQLNWTADKLQVTLLGRPEDRPFQIHLVVEETVYSGETSPEELADIHSDQRFREQIHTPFTTEIVNQLVLVPEAFFVEERKALVEAAKMWREFLRRYVERGPIGPGDPIEFLQQSIRDQVIRSSSTTTLAATINEQVEFAIREAPDLWDAALERSGSAPCPKVTILE